MCEINVMTSRHDVCCFTYWVISNWYQFDTQSVFINENVSECVKVAMAGSYRAVMPSNSLAWVLQTIWMWILAVSVLPKYQVNPSNYKRFIISHHHLPIEHGSRILSHWFYFQLMPKILDHFQNDHLSMRD